MDALPMAPVVVLRWSDSPQLPRGVACLLVVLLHALLGAWLWRSGRIDPPPAHEARISLRWLPAAPALPPPVPLRAEPAAASTARPGLQQRPPSTAPLPVDGETDEPPTMAPLSLGLPAGSIEGGDGITAAGVAPRLLGRGEIHAAFAPRRNYFHMRPQMSPEQIVQGVAQLLGLWPPGYMIDPCELGKQDMAYFQGAVRDADRQALRDAVAVVSARCR
ncbi:MAG TPA: hypothetical protein DCP40_13270 [Stenotrophomonas sp.]|nr:hypothetical protein [Stenotrophomonas sp.]